MSDGEMKDRLGALKDKIDWINKHMLRIAGGIVGTGIAIGIAGCIAVAGVAAMPLTVASAVVGLGALSLSASAGVRGGYETQIMWLSIENDDRIERAKMSQALAAAKNTPKEIPQSTMDLRDEFNEAIAKMDKGLDRSIRVGRALRFKGASYVAEF